MTNRFLTLAMLPVLLAIVLWGCEHDTSNGPVDPGDDPPVTDMTCLGCHSSQTELQLALGEEKASEVGTSFKSDG